tara:strand:+ start:357 stop:1478 length:1122 start_codon:yes stop_codon:yes gene_type:complete
MNYLGTDTREGLVLLGQSNISSNTAQVAFDGIFSGTYDVYYIEIYNLVAQSDDHAFEMQFTNGGSAISGTIKRSTRWAYTDTTGGSNATNGSSDDITTGLGNATGEHAFITGWIVPHTANEKLAKFELMHQLADGTNIKIIPSFHLSSATLCDGLDFEMSTDNIASGDFRIYGLAKEFNHIKSLNQATRNTNFVEDSYIGSVPTGTNGWSHIITSTASDGDSAIELQNCFENYDLYKVTLHDMKPSTDNQDLSFQWLSDSTAQTGTYKSTRYFQDGLGQETTTLQENQGDSVLMDGLGTNAREGGVGTYYCNPNSTNDKYLFGRSAFKMADGYGRAWYTGTSYDSTSSFNGLKLVFASGNVESGSVSVYGRNK